LSLATQLSLVESEKSDLIQCDWPITQAELEQVGQRSGVRQLLLEAGLDDQASLQAFPAGLRLDHLRVRRSQMTDRELQWLAEHQPELQILNLPVGAFSEKGIQALARLSKLRQLRLGGTSLNDQAILAMQALHQLESLHLIAPTLTAKSLSHIAAMPSLQSFYLDDCPLPDDGWTELFSKRPTLHVHIDQAHHDRDPHRDHGH
jgi:hypothetical protein